MDVSVLCSLREGFSNVILESMASGKPMIASSVGGNPEAIVEGVTGFLFDPRSPDDLAAKIKTLVNNRDLLHYMELASRKRAEEVFSTTQMVDSYDKLYAELLDSQRATNLFKAKIKRQGDIVPSSESNRETKW